MPDHAGCGSICICCEVMPVIGDCMEGARRYGKTSEVYHDGGGGSVELDDGVE